MQALLHTSVVPAREVKHAANRTEKVKASLPFSVRSGDPVGTINAGYVQEKNEWRNKRIFALKRPKLWYLAHASKIGGIANTNGM
jgi:hypothetical protein